MSRITGAICLNKAGSSFCFFSMLSPMQSRIGLPEQLLAKRNVSLTLKIAMWSSFWSTYADVVLGTNSFSNLPLYVMSPSTCKSSFDTIASESICSSTLFPAPGGPRSKVDSPGLSRTLTSFRSTTLCVFCGLKRPSKEFLNEDHTFGIRSFPTRAWPRTVRWLALTSTVGGAISRASTMVLLASTRSLKSPALAKSAACFLASVVLSLRNASSSSHSRSRRKGICHSRPSSPTIPVLRAVHASIWIDRELPFADQATRVDGGANVRLDSLLFL
mmetsp:Transcript_799/g.4999  ORF Transcript_799/g.4999 Transcript_799/m.4999 type:complete len:274 (-) Transcript_799:110-931(-)